MPLNFTAVGPITSLHRRTTPVEKTSKAKLHLRQDNGSSQQKFQQDDKNRSFVDCLELSVKKLDIKG